MALENSGGRIGQSLARERLVVGCALGTEGFSYQSDEAQEAIFSYVARCLAFVEDRSDSNKEAMMQALAEIDRSHGSRTLAFEVVLRAIGETSDSAGYEW